MKRILALLVIGGVAAWSYVEYSPPEAPEMGLAPPPAPSQLAGCTAVVDRSGAGTLGLASSLAESMDVSTIGSGTVIETRRASIDAAGGGGVPLTELLAGGLTGLLIELQTADAAASVAQVGEWGVALSRCTEPTATVLAIPGASTRNLEGLELRILNPYAVDAVVSVQSASEAGIDTASELSSIFVSARSLVTRDLSTLMPLRNTLSLLLRVDEGAVHAFVAQEGGGDRMVLEGVEAGSEWWLPVPLVSDIAPRVVLMSAAPVETEFVIEAAGPDGPLPTYEGVIAAESTIDLHLNEIGENISGLRIAASGPVAASLIFEDLGIRAGSTASQRLSTVWMLPSATAATSGTIWVYNPSDVVADLVYQPLQSGAVARRIELGPFTRESIVTRGSQAGYVVRSSTPVVVGLTIAGESGVGFSLGEPLDEFDG